MGYCSLQDIKNEFKQLKLDSDGSAVNEEKVLEWIKQDSSYINSKISVKYQVPVTAGPDALNLLKKICTWLVSDRIRFVTEVKNVRPEGDQDVKTSLYEKAETLLDEIAEGDLPLIGASPVTGSGGVGSYTSSNRVPRVFKKVPDQW